MTDEINPKTMESRLVKGSILPEKSWISMDSAEDLTCSGPGHRDLLPGKMRHYDDTNASKGKIYGKTIEYQTQD